MADAAAANEHLDIEARQDELLRQLDELNARVEQALFALVGERSANPDIVRMLPAATGRKTAKAA